MRAEKDREEAMTIKEAESIASNEYLAVGNDSKRKGKVYFRVIWDHLNWDTLN